MENNNNNKNGKNGKLGWNQAIDKIEALMAADGHPYKFGSFSRTIATDAYAPAKAAVMTAEQNGASPNGQLILITWTHMKWR